MNRECAALTRDGLHKTGNDLARATTSYREGTDSQAQMHIPSHDAAATNMAAVRAHPPAVNAPAAVHTAGSGRPQRGGRLRLSAFQHLQVVAQGPAALLAAWPRPRRSCPSGSGPREKDGGQRADCSAWAPAMAPMRLRLAGTSLRPVRLLARGRPLPLTAQLPTFVPVSSGPPQASNALLHPTFPGLFRPWGCALA